MHYNKKFEVYKTNHNNAKKDQPRCFQEESTQSPTPQESITVIFVQCLL
jgi:hypothetical protein